MNIKASSARKLRRLRVYCEEVFTAETQRGEAAAKKRKANFTTKRFMILRSPTGDEKWGHIVSILLGPPFPLMGKGWDRGAREPIKPITPTFVLPRRGEGIRALPPVGSFISRPVAQSKINFSKEDAKSTKFIIKKIRTLRGLRDLRGEDIFSHRKTYTPIGRI